MEIIFDIMGGTLVAELFGELDHHAAEKARDRIDTALDNHGVKNLVFDFTNVSFMDSSGIGLVMGRYKLMQELNGKVTVRNPPNHIRKVMRLSGIDRLASISSGQEGI